jgi:hypothetical protein
LASLKRIVEKLWLAAFVAAALAKYGISYLISVLNG